MPAAKQRDRNYLHSATECVLTVSTRPNLSDAQHLSTSSQRVTSQTTRKTSHTFASNYWWGWTNELRLTRWGWTVVPRLNRQECLPRHQLITNCNFLAQGRCQSNQHKEAHAKRKQARAWVHTSIVLCPSFSSTTETFLLLISESFCHKTRSESFKLGTWECKEEETNYKAYQSLRQPRPLLVRKKFHTSIHILECSPHRRLRAFGRRPNPSRGKVSSKQKTDASKMNAGHLPCAKLALAIPMSIACETNVHRMRNQRATHKGSRTLGIRLSRIAPG